MAFSDAGFDGGIVFFGWSSRCHAGRMGGICQGHPALVEISISTHHKTTENIRVKQAFTISPADAAHIEAVDYFDMVSEHKENKQEKAGFHEHKSIFVDAPVIEEFPVALECRVVSMKDEDGETLIIGEILNVSAEETVLNENGTIDMGKVDALSYDPVIRSYRKVTEVVGKAFSVGKRIKDGATE